MSVEILFNGKNFKVQEASSYTSLEKGFFGVKSLKEKSTLDLDTFEAMYLNEVRNALIFNSKTLKPISFNELAGKHSNEEKFLAKYFAFKDWRDKGLIARNISEAKEHYGKSPVIKYPDNSVKLPKLSKTKILFFKDDLMGVIDDNEVAANLYEQYWLGQYGTYKARKHGQYGKLDAYETLFLIRNAKMKCNYSEKQIIKQASLRRKDFKSLYSVYEEWRLKNYVVKTGFKFGTHFRLYFPGAKPVLDTEEWMHSKHVIQVFPRQAKLIISEWSRAIRVAHGVKKTFILAIPGKKKNTKAKLDFLLYYRHGGNSDKPNIEQPKYAMLALSEEEEIGGNELSRAIQESKELGLDLLLAICDRETAITYYRIKRIELPKSQFEYYEIEWMQP
ncbi:tRNA-splicing endonuclease [uncultured archaeon]|nr:tRNA-splicing endonuclease [uncultured archaeon]